MPALHYAVFAGIQTSYFLADAWEYARTHYPDYSVS